MMFPSDYNAKTIWKSFKDGKIVDLISLDHFEFEYTPGIAIQ